MSVQLLRNIPHKLPFFIGLFSLVATVLLPSVHASALSGSDFNAGNIISSAVFTNYTTMSVSDIQNFLNAKVPTCSTNHTGFTGGTGTVYNPPFVCLKDFYENPNSTYTVSFSYTDTNGNPQTGSRTYYNNNAYKVTALCPIYGGYNTSQTPSCTTNYGDYHQGIDHLIPTLQTSGLSTPSGALSAAQIIYNAAQQYSINPQVLLVTLQKEQGLVTDDWPASYEYQEAMGYGCPDTAPCSSNYAGFSNQIISAAWQFRQYLNNPNNYNYVVGSNYIQYNPDASCGGSTVNIQNQATAALYDYTPYQPNAAALSGVSNSSPGGIVTCGAYGNRNFWWYFTTWFGSTQTSIPYAWIFSSESVYADSAHTQPLGTPGGRISVQPNQEVYISINADNNGYQIWDQSTVRLGTTAPQDRCSIFADSSWLSCARIQMVQNSVVPGTLATFNFSITAPSQVGSYNERLNMVAEGITWMNDPIFYLPIDVVAHQTPTNTQSIELKTNQTLLPGQYLMSPDAHSVLLLQKDGNLVLYSDFLPVWSSGKFDSAVKNLVLQSDGNLVEYDTNGQAIWASGTNGSGTPQQLTMQTDGNVVIYDASNTPLWATGTSVDPDHLSYVNHVLPAGGVIYPGQSLSTASGSYKLIFQTDGNLVLYNASNKALWASGTYKQPMAYAQLQGDGNFIMYRTDHTIAWSSGSAKGIAYMIMQDDGNLVIYNSAKTATWTSNTYGE